MKTYVGIDPGKLTHISGDLYKFKKRYRKAYINYYVIKTICAICGSIIYRYRRSGKLKRSVCTPICKNELMSGSNNPNWTGGRKYKTSGHILIYLPNHPGSKKGYYPEHRAIIENKIGRYLNQDEVIHHINCDPTDNSIDNLFLVAKNKHNKVHANLEKCVKALMEKGLLRFNQKSMLYETTEGLRG